MLIIARVDHQKINNKHKRYDIKVAIILLPTIFILLYGVLQMTKNILHNNSSLLLVCLVFVPLFFGLLWLSKTAGENYREVMKLKETVYIYEDYIISGNQEKLDIF